MTDNAKNMDQFARDDLHIGNITSIHCNVVDRLLHRNELSATPIAQRIIMTSSKRTPNTNVRKSPRPRRIDKFKSADDDKMTTAFNRPCDHTLKTGDECNEGRHPIGLDSNTVSFDDIHLLESELWCASNAVLQLGNEKSSIVNASSDKDEVRLCDRTPDSYNIPWLYDLDNDEEEVDVRPSDDRRTDNDIGSLEMSTADVADACDVIFRNGSVIGNGYANMAAGYADAGECGYGNLRCGFRDGVGGVAGGDDDDGGDGLAYRARLSSGDRQASPSPERDRFTDDLSSVCSSSLSVAGDQTTSSVVQRRNCNGRPMALISDVDGGGVAGTRRLSATPADAQRSNAIESNCPSSSNDGGNVGKSLLEKALDRVRRRLEEDANVSPHGVTPRGSPESTALLLKNAYIKNLVVLGVGLAFVFTAFFALRNLQTSVNAADGLGSTALACQAATFAVGCLAAPAVVRRARPKRVVVVAVAVGHLAFAVANLYSRFWTLLPATAALGFAAANLLVAEATYVTSLAVTYAAAAGRSPEHVIGLFHGFFLFMTQVAHVLGSLVTSGVLHYFSSPVTAASAAQRATDDGDDIIATPVDDVITTETGTTRSGKADEILGRVFESQWKLDQNPEPFFTLSSLFVSDSSLIENVSLTSSKSSSCGVAYDHNNYPLLPFDSAAVGTAAGDDVGAVDYNAMVVLVFIFIGLTVVGLLVLALLLDKLDVIFHESRRGPCAQLLAVGRLHRDPRMLLLLPMMLFLGLQQAFVYGEFTRVNSPMLFSLLNF